MFPGGSDGGDANSTSLILQSFVAAAAAATAAAAAGMEKHCQYRQTEKRAWLSAWNTRQIQICIYAYLIDWGPSTMVTNACVVGSGNESYCNSHPWVVPSVIVTLRQQSVRRHSKRRLQSRMWWVQCKVVFKTAFPAQKFRALIL